MANPAPRPALRKAPDAHINPAHPNRNEIDLRTKEIRVAQAKPAPLPDKAASSLEDVIRADKPVVGPEVLVEQADKKSAQNGKQNRSTKSKPTKPTKSKKSGKGGAGEKPKSKSAKSKSKPAKAKKGKHAKHAANSGKMTLSAEARRKLRAADKARGASLDSTVDALVADLRSPKKG